MSIDMPGAFDRLYMCTGDLHVEQTGRVFAWRDTRTHGKLFKASEFVRKLKHRQSIQIACLEEVSLAQVFTSVELTTSHGTMFANTICDKAILKAV